MGICGSLDAVRVTEDAQKPSFSSLTADAPVTAYAVVSALLAARLTIPPASGSTAPMLLEKAPVRTFFRTYADVITTSRHLLPRDLASQPHCESRSGRIVGKHVEALTRSESTMDDDGEAASTLYTLTTTLTSTSDDRDDQQKGAIAFHPGSQASILEFPQEMLKQGLDSTDNTMKAATRSLENSRVSVLFPYFLVDGMLTFSRPATREHIGVVASFGHNVDCRTVSLTGAHVPCVQRCLCLLSLCELCYLPLQTMACLRDSTTTLTRPL